MFRFENPELLWFLVVVPILIGFFMWVLLWRKRKLDQLASQQLIKQLIEGNSGKRHTIKFFWLLCGLIFLVIGIANPQWGRRQVNAKAKGVDIFIALDISQSMLANDVRPNRMELAKKFAKDFILSRASDRIGLIVFAGDAFLQMPLTSDKKAANLFLSNASPSMAPSQGTAIGDAIKLAIESFDEEEKSSRAVVLITDGENHDSSSKEMAKAASDAGVTLYPTGVGTIEGGFFVDISNNRGEYKKDDNGNPVKSKLNESMLRELAIESGGSSYLLSDIGKVLNALSQDIDLLEKREIQQATYTDYASHFQIFVIIALILFLLEFILSYQKNPPKFKFDLFN